MFLPVQPKSVFLTVNRACNMNCKICYAREAVGNLGDMSLELACSLTKLAVDSGAKMITLIGGEPTLWPWLKKYNQFTQGYIRTSIVTNALAFANLSYQKKYSQNPNYGIGISLKASTPEKLSVTAEGVNWGKMLKGVRQALKLPRSGVSFVCTPDDCDITRAATLVKSLGGSSLSLNLYRPSFISGQWESVYEWAQIREMLLEIVRQFPIAEKIFDGKLSLSGKYPLCVWPKSFLDERIVKHQISTGCMLSKRKGLVFDSKGSVVMCNHLHPYLIGQYGVDFTTTDEFLAFLGKNTTMQIYDQTSRFPSLKCKECKIYDICTGGCVVLWTYFQPDAIVQPERR